MQPLGQVDDEKSRATAPTTTCRGHCGNRLHDKGLLADDVLALGSASFSEASHLNVERGVRLRYVLPEDLQGEKDNCYVIFARGLAFNGCLGQPLSLTPQRL